MILNSDNLPKTYNVLALNKGDQKHIFVYDEDSAPETLRTLGRYASSPDLNLSWYDAAILSQKIRENAGVESEHSTESDMLAPKIMLEECIASSPSEALATIMKKARSRMSSFPTLDFDF